MMRRATRRLAGLATGFVLCAGLGLLEAPTAPASGAPATTTRTATAARSISAPRPLAVHITGVGDGAIHLGRALVVRGVVTNRGTQTWTDVTVALQITPDPALSLRVLQYWATIPDNPGIGNTVTDPDLAATVGVLRPSRYRPFELRVPYADLGISGVAGVYRVAVKVSATDASTGLPYPAGAYRSTLMPLLPQDTASIVASPTLTLLPITAAVKRVADGAFADDSLSRAISPHGRLTNVLDWLGLAPVGTVQVVIDPAVLAAITDMSDGYRIETPSGPRKTAQGQGRIDAELWLAKFNQVAGQQHVLYLPWGEPAIDSLLAQRAPGPMIEAVHASESYRDVPGVPPLVVGWQRGGSTGVRAVTLLRRHGVGIQIVAEGSLPALASYSRTGRFPPGHIVIRSGNRDIHALVAATDLAGLTTETTTSPLQFRQRLISQAAVRSISGRTAGITVTALPFGWNPGPLRVGQSLARALPLPVFMAQSAVGALDRRGLTYHGAVRPLPGKSPTLVPPIISAIHDLRAHGAPLAAIEQPGLSAKRAFRREFAMSGSTTWADYPVTGARMVSAAAGRARNRLARVHVTGPPFVAMSGDSGRFPLTVSNDLDTTVVVGVTVTPDDPALSVAPIPSIQLPPGQHRDIQVHTTAAGSGVTSVTAQLSTPEGLTFGKPWSLDIRATQIGLFIWAAMGVGAAILLFASGRRLYRRWRDRDGGGEQRISVE